MTDPSGETPLTDLANSGFCRQLCNDCFDPVYLVTHPKECWSLNQKSVSVPFNYSECYLEEYRKNLGVGPNYVEAFSQLICSNKGDEAANYLREESTGWSVEVFGYQTSGPALFHAFIMLSDWKTNTQYGYSAGPTNLLGAGGLIDQIIHRDDDAYGAVKVYCTDPAPGCNSFTDKAFYDQTGGPRLVIAAEYGDAAAIKSCLSNEASRIAMMRQLYYPQGPNSNTFVSTLLRKCNLPNIEPDGNPFTLVDSENFPGWNNRQLD